MIKKILCNSLSACLLLSLSSWSFAAELVVSVTDIKNLPVVDAVVYAEPIGKKAASSAAPINIEQKNKQFIPMVSVAQVGTSISFPNRDSVRHHVYSFSPAKTFELKLYSGVPADPIVFDKAGTVILGCNIHDNMLAYIQIVDTPYFGKTDASGKAKLHDLPEGKYTLKTWHYATIKENFITEQSFDTKNGATAAVKLELNK